MKFCTKHHFYLCVLQISWISVFIAVKRILSKHIDKHKHSEGAFLFNAVNNQSIMLFELNFMLEQRVSLV